MSDIYVLVDRDYDAHQFAMDYLNSTKFNQAMQSDWNEARMDIIGQNGNEGYHYEAICKFDDRTVKKEGQVPPSVAYYPPGQYNKYDSKPTEKETMNKLILDHWSYIEGVLVKAGKPIEIIQEIGYHYKTAFAHGWRHGVEACSKGVAKWDGL